MIKKGTERLNQHGMRVAAALHAHGVRGQAIRTGLRRNAVETMAVSAKHGCKVIRVEVVARPRCRYGEEERSGAPSGYQGVQCPRCRFHHLRRDHA